MIFILHTLSVFRDVPVWVGTRAIVYEILISVRLLNYLGLILIGNCLKLVLVLITVLGLFVLIKVALHKGKQSKSEMRIYQNVHFVLTILNIK